MLDQLQDRSMSETIDFIAQAVSEEAAQTLDFKVSILLEYGRDRELEEFLQELWDLL